MVRYLRMLLSLIICAFVLIIIFLAMIRMSRMPRESSKVVASYQVIAWLFTSLTMHYGLQDVAQFDTFSIENWLRRETKFLCLRNGILIFWKLLPLGHVWLAESHGSILWWVTLRLLGIPIVFISHKNVGYEISRSICCIQTRPNSQLAPDISLWEISIS